MKSNLGLKNDGFTLIELMIVVIIVAILAAIAIPSYQEYIRKSEATRVNQAMMDLAQELERHKARNFNYAGFAQAATAQSVKDSSYTITIVDGTVANNPALTAATAIGQKWVMRANANDNYSKKFNFLLNSDNFKCKNKSFSVMTYSTCGTGAVVGW